MTQLYLTPASGGTSSVTETERVSTGVEADEERLRALFENLFRNAVEHTEADCTVTVTESEAGGARFEFDSE